MNYKITYTDATNLLGVTTSGKMNAVDFIAMAKDILQHPRWVPDSNILFDHTALDFSDVSVDDLQKIRAFHMDNEEKIGNGKSAIVVKVGLCSSWNKLWSQGEKIKTGNREQVFEDRNDALNWIAS